MRFTAGLIVGLVLGIAPFAIACWLHMATDLYRDAGPEDDDTDAPADPGLCAECRGRRESCP